MKEDMTFWDHLGELRKRIIWILVVFVLAMIAGLFFAGDVVTFLKESEPAAGVAWNVFSPWDSISIYTKVAFMIALTVTLPFILYQLWVFVKPGLKEQERVAAIKYIPLGFGFFLAGLAFAYFVVFPLAFQFTESVTAFMNLTETYGIMQYFSFMFNILLPVSLLFELPVLVMFLTKLRILNPQRLRAARKISYMILIIVATMITPPDLVSDLLVGVPLILLYELSVLLSSVVYRKQQKEEQAMEHELEHA